MRLNDMITAERIINGDVRAFEALINTHKIRVFNYCLGFVADHYIAEDLAQEVFIKVYRNIGSYDWKKAALATWIFRIARNTCLNHVRDNIANHSEILDTNMVASSARDQTNLENRIMLLQAFAKLPAADRDLVVLKDYLGFGYHEVGRILNIPTGTVKSRLHSIRARLRAILGDIQ
ncbi:MAG: RNA polymerase sigma factor [Candidatus Saccharibacteria bacterium]